MRQPINIVLLCLLIMSASASAQRICPLDGYLSLIYINDTTEVTIQTRWPKTDLGGTYQFIKEGDSIKGSVPYYHYPSYIKTRNNNFKLSLYENDSVIYDERGRVSKVWSRVERKDTFNVYSERKYLNDSTVIEMYHVRGSNDIGVILVALDKKQNVKYIKDGQVPNMITIDQVSENAFFELKRFYYNATRSRINHIQVFDLNKFPLQLKYTQTFEYKNCRPVKCTVKNNIKNKIEYVQEYSYRVVSKENNTKKAIYSVDHD